MIRSVAAGDGKMRLAFIVVVVVVGLFVCCLFFVFVCLFPPLWGV